MLHPPTNQRDAKYKDSQPTTGTHGASLFFVAKDAANFSKVLCAYGLPHTHKATPN